MNYIQFSLFIIYILSALSAGHGINKIIGRDTKFRFNRCVYLGETLLLGSIIIYTQMMLISFTGLYNATFLWGAVLLNFLFLLDKNVRNEFRECLLKKVSWDIPVIVFLILTSIFIFRNCFYMMDVDSHSVYLYTQKLWLANGSSFFGDASTDSRIFVPQFDALPYGLGISIFPNDTLFPELINLFWRLIVLLLIFGYTSYRFNRYFGLGAAMMVLFNDHFYYSGANVCCIINAALTAFLFTAGYHFLESRKRNDPYYFFLALIFLSQLMSNKYQMAYIFFFMIGFGFVIQPSFAKTFKYILNKKQFIILVTAYVITALWYLKNWIVTGLPTFPILAGYFSVLDWVPEKSYIFLKVFGGLDPMRIIKFISYLFVWPGINPAKYVWISIVFFPFAIVIASRNKLDKERIFELTYWLSLSILFIIGICLTMHQDPRYYRYAIAIFAFTSIYSINYILRDCLQLNTNFLIGGVILLLSIPGYKLMFSEGTYKRPYFKDNINVLLNRIQMDDIADRYYLETRIARNGILKNKEKFENSAWNTEGINGFSAFLLPIRPQVKRWYTTTVKWDSYKDENLIVRDLNAHGIKWLMRVKNGQLIFISNEEYAQEAVHYNLRPKNTEYNYGFPNEIREVRY